jgi:hypothetical protein
VNAVAAGQNRTPGPELGVLVHQSSDAMYQFCLLFLG